MSKFIIDEIILESDFVSENQLQIASNPNSYSVLFKNFIPNFTNNDFLLIDKNIHALYGINHDKIKILNAVEQEKTINTVLEVCEWLSNNGFDKGSHLYVVGGGIIQDIGAFVGSIFKRGIKWTYVPTTLLSQCDSCIGAKTALNFNGMKNQLALFSAPYRVIIDTRFLSSLPPQEILSGMGEIIKFFLIGGEDYLSTLNDDIEEQIKNGLLIKKAVIEYDEYEKGIRKSLNYGHSFGHAIEAASNYSIPHGEAVLLGIEVINQLYTHSDIISTTINRFTNIEKIRHLTTKQILDLLKHDKKTQLNKISLVIVDKPGITRFLSTPIDDNLKKKLHGIFAY